MRGFLRECVFCVSRLGSVCAPLLRLATVSSTSPHLFSPPSPPLVRRFAFARSSFPLSFLLSLYVCVFVCACVCFDRSVSLSNILFFFSPLPLRPMPSGQLSTWPLSLVFLSRVVFCVLACFFFSV